MLILLWYLTGMIVTLVIELMSVLLIPDVSKKASAVFCIFIAVLSWLAVGIVLGMLLIHKKEK